VPGDISEPADLDRLYDAVRARGKGLNALFANARTAGFATLETTTEEHLDRIFGVNVRGTLFTVQKALPLLNEGASVTLNSSTRADDGIEAFGTRLWPLRPPIALLKQVAEKMTVLVFPTG
jgi:NAD(P)-dependent dehydrogenase (short-subunit alcohol dehydrogenase family)